MSLLYMSITIHSIDGLYLFLNETNYIVWLFQKYCCWFAVAKSYPTLQRLGLPHGRLPCPSLSPWVCSNSYPLSQWCHPIISSSVIPFSPCLQSSLASGSFPMSSLFAWSSQSIGASALASVLPMKIQDFRTGWLDLLAV